MTPEESLFIDILRDHIWRRPSAPRGVPDWDALGKLARSHHVEGIVYYQCKEFMPGDRRAALFEQMSARLYGYANQKNALREISDALKGKNILFSTVKGMGIAELYPVPALRTMGDIDFIISPGDMKRAVGILREMGYKDTEEIYSHEWAGDRNGIHIEVHDEIVRRYEHASEKQDGVFQRVSGLYPGREVGLELSFPVPER